MTTKPEEDDVELFRSEGGKGVIHGGTKVCFAESEQKAQDTVMRLWPNEGLPGELAQVLPTPQHLEQASELVTPDRLSAPLGPDLDKHVEALKEYEKAGIDELFVQQIGPGARRLLQGMGVLCAAEVQQLMASDFERLMAGLDYSMFVVTAAGKEEVSGCLVGFTNQTSIHPPRFLVCLSRKNRTFRVASGAGHLAVHLVPADRIDLAEIFGGLTTDDTDKLGLCEWESGPHGLPIVSGCPNWFAGPIVDRFEFGDHHGFLLEPETVSDAELREALLFSEVSRLEPGHEP